LPGPRARVGWGLWAWLAMTVLVLFQQGGIAGGVGQALAIAAPLTERGAQADALHEERVERQVRAALAGEANDPARDAAIGARLEAIGEPADALLWTLILALPTALLLAVGRYGLIQAVAGILVAAFTALTMLALLKLQARPDWAVRWAEIGEGLRLRLPAPRDDGVKPMNTALATFGIIGVGAAELVMYPYWCLEKGYARWTGRDDGSPGWAARAHGWMRVMRLDAFLSMAIYTAATLVFYLLGAAVLGRAGLDPEGAGMVRTLAAVYAPVFGEAAPGLFLAGAVVVLYSTFFVGCAGLARVGADALLRFGLVREDAASQRRAVQVLGAVIPLFGALAFALVRAPEKLILASGVAQALMLPVLGLTALWLRYRRTPRSLAPGLLWDIGLVLSFLGFLLAGGWLALSKLVPGLVD